MSNEELAKEIQAGATDRMADLWEQVEGLCCWKAKQVIAALQLRGNPCGVEFDDLYQTGYLARWRQWKATSLKAVLFLPGSCFA